MYKLLLLVSLFFYSEVAGMLLGNIPAAQERDYLVVPVEAREQYLAHFHERIKIIQSNIESLRCDLERDPSDAFSSKLMLDLQSQLEEVKHASLTFLSTMIFDLRYAR